MQYNDWNAMTNAAKPQEPWKEGSHAVIAVVICVALFVLGSVFAAVNANPSFIKADTPSTWVGKKAGDVYDRVNNSPITNGRYTEIRFDSYDCLWKTFGNQSEAEDRERTVTGSDLTGDSFVWIEVGC